MMSSARSRNRSPFTPNQWQELEQQTLVFKYMVTGTPIPPDLIFSIKRSLDSSISSRIFPHPPIGWGCFGNGIWQKSRPRARKQSITGSKPLDHSEFQPHDGSTTHHRVLDFGSYSHDGKDYMRHVQVQGIIDGTMDETTFFPEDFGSSRSYHDSYQQRQLNSFKSSSYASSQFQNIKDDDPRQTLSPQQQLLLHYVVCMDLS
ncbi:hypothetical protein KIW84_072351 [Lathyrus oleraceus]|uniref:Growth-regulating factor n=1 Tax=Pisum sativum TaxID=3888 RepID=A0A9D4VN49_PEA|nr:hypothetical protein KIW84_072351 [Pisum sativum]